VEDVEDVVHYLLQQIVTPGAAVITGRIKEE
jgi:hypothetical protein